ncbi:MAG: polyphosphate kinase 1, partial [Hyphomonadaceae bacterium]|nr:polyphosphate kinase 1 [Clostridia bacterium]
TDNLLLEIKKSLKKRQWGAAVRLEIDQDVDERLVSVLKKALELVPHDIYYISGPIDLTFLFKLYNKIKLPQLKYEQHIPEIPPVFLDETSYFHIIAKEDILLHHPYDAFTPVVDFISQAAKDPQVLAIKQTLYRISGNSPIIAALSEAAEGGKQVTVLIEVKARFDEENNIQWATRLEQAGCHVIYGLVGLKTHAKMTLVVRREESGIKRYLHLGTGNYNDVTATLYTDIGLFTANEQLGSDASAVFNTLSGYSDLPKLQKLSLAPVGLRDTLIALIEREIVHAKKGKKARIIAKMNALSDIEIIRHLYRASQAGVKIQLIVRGICCLKPNIQKVSHNISVVSIVGKFLEHSRIFYFSNDTQEEVYLSSADWMARNLNRRVELFFPILQASLKDRIKKVLAVLLKDREKARRLTPSGRYLRYKHKTKVLYNSQDVLSAAILSDLPLEPSVQNIFKPRHSEE